MTAITQDSRGFMWFGTNTGLSRYDGYRMVTYRNQRGDARTLGDNTVWAIHEDRQGVLWLGTEGGLSRYDRAQDKFTTFMRDEGEAAAARMQVRVILEDSRRNLWIGTTTGMYIFDRARDTAIAYPLVAPGAVKPRVLAIYEDRRKHLWVGTQNDGVWDIDPVTGTVRRYAHDRPGTIALPGNRVEAFIEDAKGRFWVAVYEAGLVLLDPKSGQQTNFRHDARDPASLSNDYPRRFALDRKGWLWLATENGGLEHFDPDTRTFHHLRINPNNPLGIGSDSFWSLFFDKTGALWAGSFSGGVDVLRPSSEAIQRFSSVGNDSTSLSLNSVLGFAQDSTGAFWVATDGGGLNRLDPRTGRFRRYTTANSNLNRDAVLGVSVDRYGKIWLATWQGGVSVLDPTTRRFTAYTTHNTNLSQDEIFSVLADGKGRIWAGTWTNGLVLLDPAKKAFTSFHIDRPGLESQIWIIREMRDGRLLLATVQNGLVVFDPATSHMTRYELRRGDPMSLSSSKIHAILEESPGVVWIGTPAGLDRLDLNARSVAHFTSKDGLPSDMISGLVFDRSGNLWVSTDAGVVRFDYKHKTSWKFAADDGLQGREFTARSYMGGRDGEVLFGGNNGFNIIRPELLTQNTRKPRIAFTDFQVFNKPVEIGKPGSPLTVQISEAKEITLDYTQSVFTLEFAALDFTASAKNRYAYKLEGFDHDWTDAGATRAATYTSLAPAKYVFRVKASNNDGVWNEQGISIAITITPPFWATWWFRTFIVLLVVAVIASITRASRARHRRLRAMNEQLGRAAEHDRVSQQYLENNVLDILGAMQRFSGGDYAVALDVRSDDAIGKLRLGFNSVVADRKRAEEALLQSQKMEAVGRLAGGVAHDFNNLLTVIKGNTQLAIEDLDSKEAVRGELEEIDRAADRATELTRQLLAFSRKQILKPRTFSLNDMVGELGRMLRRTVGEDIALEIVLDPLLGMVMADRGQLEQVVLNLVVNARDAMPRGGKLLIETKNIDTSAMRNHAEGLEIPYVAIVVSDSGSGMSPAVRDRVFEPFYTTKEQGKGTGLGLSTVYGSVKQSGGFVMVESELGKGSTFGIYLPRVDAVDEPSVTDAFQVSPSGDATILLVEDEEALRRLASRVLTRSGYNVLTAASGDAALEVAALYPGTIDLLVTDVVMPGMSGRELAERLMPLRPGMRLLYASGYTQDAIILHGVSSLETAFLGKPFTPDALLRKVRGVLDAAAVDAVIAA
ncbi:MAG: two-component regulator propeller domain-containing protein [bacterium]